MSALRSSQLLVDANVIGNNCVDTASFAGGGIYAAGSSGALRGNIIRDNCALLAGGVAAGDKAFTVINNLVEGNIGGGLLLQAGTVTNNTVRNNPANQYGEHGQGLLLSAPAASSSITVANNIVVGNGYGISTFGSGLSVTLMHNDVWGNLAKDYLGIDPGQGDISADPRFLPPGAVSYRLQSDSPCIDRGVNEGVPPVDIENNPRPQDGDGDGSAVADIGAVRVPGVDNDDPHPDRDLNGPGPVPALDPGKRGRCPHADGNRDGHADAYTFRNPHGHGDTHRNYDAHQHAHGHGDTYRNRDAHQHVHGHGDTYRNR